MWRGVRLYQAGDGAGHAVFPHLANCVTALRIVLSGVLAFLPALSNAFMCLYALTGLTDMLDGFIARRTRAQSDFGARLDSAADAVFVIVCAAKMLPCLAFPRYICLWALGIAATRVVCLLLRKLRTPHTLLNKGTGLLLFLYPFRAAEGFAIVICGIASLAVLQEGYLIVKGKRLS